MKGTAASLAVVGVLAMAGTTAGVVLDGESPLWLLINSALIYGGWLAVWEREDARYARRFVPLRYRVVATPPPLPVDTHRRASTTVGVR